MNKLLPKIYIALLLVMLYSPILIIIVFSFTEAKVLGNWTGFSFKLYTSLFQGGIHHSLTSALWNTLIIGLIAAFASVILGTVAAIGIYNLKPRSRSAVQFVNNIPICLFPSTKYWFSWFINILAIRYPRSSNLEYLKESKRKL